MTNKVRLNLWLPRKVRDSFRASAKRQSRSMSNLAEVLFKGHSKRRIN